jgi:hypothetical protein
MSNLSKLSSFWRGALMLTAALGCAAVVANAQTTDPVSTTSAVTLKMAAGQNTSSSAYSSSADQTVTPPANTNLALNVKPFNFLNAMQYGSGSRSGAPRYRGGNSNADGSNRWIFFGGAGLSSPAGGTTSSNFTANYSFQGGAGRQFSKKFAVPIQFDYNRFGMSSTALTNEEQVYNTMANQYNAAHPGCAGTPAGCATPPNPLDGNMHVWSFTVDPTETFSQGDSLGIYAVEGVGFYHKVSNFLTPQTGVYFDPFYGPIQYTANQVIDHYTSNAVGFNGGLGLTYKFSRFSNERFYAEVRYVFVDNPLRNGITVANMNSSPNNYLVANDFPANSLHTAYLPINVGIRF